MAASQVTQRNPEVEPVDGKYKSSDCSAEEAQLSKKAKRGSSVLTWTPIKIHKHVQWKETMSPDWLLSSLGPLPLAPQSDSNVVFSVCFPSVLSP